MYTCKYIHVNYACMCICRLAYVCLHYILDLYWIFIFDSLWTQIVLQLVYSYSTEWIVPWIWIENARYKFQGQLTGNILQKMYASVYGFHCWSQLLFKFLVRFFQVKWFLTSYILINLNLSNLIISGLSNFVWPWICEIQ